MASNTKLGTYFVTGLLLFSLPNIIMVHGATLQEVQKACATGFSEQECEFGPYCVGFNTPGVQPNENKCSNIANANSASTECQVYVSIHRTADKKYQFTLLGQVKNNNNGWVAIGFSKEREIMKEGNVGAVCTAKDKKVQIYNLKSIPQNGAEDNPDSKKTKDMISDVTVQVNEKWLICEFKITGLEFKGFRNIGLAGHTDASGFGGQHQYRGSSGADEDFFEILKIRPSSDAPGQQLISTTTIMITTSISIFGIMKMMDLY